MSKAAGTEPDIPYAGLAGFRSAIRIFLKHSEDLARADGVTGAQYQALLAIAVHENGEPSLKNLAEELLLLPHGAVQLVNRLETMGLVSRRRSPDDARVVLVTLTGAGQQTLAKLARAHLLELQSLEPLLAESLKRLRKVQRTAGASGGG